MTLPAHVRERDGGTEVKVRLVSRAGKNEIVEPRAGRLVVRVSAPARV